MTETVRAEARRIDKNLPLYDMRTMTTLRSEAVSTRRFILLIVGAFGLLALGLAAIGVYGVMSLIVSERTREVGVRLALGAEPAAASDDRDAGSKAGRARRGDRRRRGAAARAAARQPAVRDWALDPITFVSVPLMLLAIAALAAVVPARKAMSIDPLAALRIE